MSIEEGNRSRRRVVAAGIIGNVMEWYDFSVYGFFARTIGNLYFPSDDPLTSLLAAFGVFAIGFLMRPLGAVLFGHIGDRVGRGPALLWSVVAMAVPTFAIGLLPIFAQIGLAASVLMLLCRIVQGLAVGGEFTSSAVFLAETAHPQRRGAASAWAPFGAVAGILLGSAVGADHPMFPAFYIMAGAVISVVAALSVHERAREAIGDSVLPHLPVQTKAI